MTKSIRSIAFSALPLAFFVSAALSTAQADAVFTFDDLISGTVAPFSSTVNGLTASFTGPVSACDVTTGNFATLSGIAVIQDFCNPPQLGPIDVAFSSNLSRVTFDFATAFAPAGSLTLQAYEGTTLVGTSTFTSSVPPGNFPNAEGFADFSGLFNNLVLTSSSILAVDNLSATTVSSAATPEPASLWMLALGATIVVSLAYRKRFN